MGITGQDLIYSMLSNRCRSGSYRRYRTWYWTGYRSRTCVQQPLVRNPGAKGDITSTMLLRTGRSRDNRSVWSVDRYVITCS